MKGWRGAVEASQYGTEGVGKSYVSVRDERSVWVEDVCEMTRLVGRLDWIRGRLVGIVARRASPGSSDALGAFKDVEHVIDCRESPLL